ncbi:hypothetical protein OH76DRAFT_60825 [Lentinus brumalis]|uniref:Uncharacterized protein n=1 Tax=Lentinus brumalis TaxID=2498619 RepID=A0A371DKC9_9APHY|nr:hypothetical protein OH76DRAFT_60825 [Polyporus brumalis]
MCLAVRVPRRCCGAIESGVFELPRNSPGGVCDPEELAAGGVEVALCGVVVRLGGAAEDGLEEGGLGHRERWRGRMRRREYMYTSSTPWRRASVPCAFAQRSDALTRGYSGLTSLTARHPRRPPINAVYGKLTRCHLDRVSIACQPPRPRRAASGRRRAGEGEWVGLVDAGSYIR